MATAPWSKSRSTNTSSYFLGAVAESGEFTLYRPAKGTNTYAPRLRGKITQAANGQSLVRVTMSVRPVAVAILVGFFAFMEYQTWKAGDNVFIAPLVLVVFHVALYIVGYHPEAVRARQILEGVLTGDLVPLAEQP